MKRLACDLDGTLAPEGPVQDRMFQPAIDRVRSLVNRAHAAGIFVVIYTARGWNEYRTTEEWLLRMGIHYDLLLMNKYNYDFLLDDRASNNVDDLERFLENA